MSMSQLYILLYINLVGFSKPLSGSCYNVSSNQLVYKNYLTGGNSVCDRAASPTLWKLGLQGFESQKSNKTCHCVNGNRKNPGYKIAGWNCGRGLMSRNEKKTDKIVDIKLFIEKNNPSLFGVIESDIHGPNSPSNRITTFIKQLTKYLLMAIRYI